MRASVLIGLVRAEDEEQAERAAKQRMRKGRDLRECKEATEQADDRSDRQDEEHRTLDALEHERSWKCPHVPRPIDCCVANGGVVCWRKGASENPYKTFPAF